MLWAARPEGVTAVEVAAESPAAPPGIAARRRAACRQRVADRTPADVVEYQHRSSAGHAALLHARPARRAAGARRLAGAGAARQLDVFRARGRRPLHAARRRVGAAAPAATIRRRCTSSGCASRSSASFTFSFNGPFDRLDWIVLLGRRGRDGAAAAAAAAFHAGVSRSVRRGRASRPSRRCVAAHVPAGAGARRRARRGRRRAARIVDGAAVLARARPARSRRAASICSSCAVAALVVLMRAFGEITSVTGRRQLRWIAWGTALGVGPFAFGYALPWALGVESAARAAADGDPARPRAADLRVGDRPLPAARRRGHHQARRWPTPRSSRASVALYFAMLQAGRLRLRRTTPIRTTGSSRCWRRSSSCCWRSR